MKKLFKALTVTVCSALIALTFVACGGDKPVNYDGTYKWHDEETGYYFLVIKNDKMTTYFSEADDFNSAIEPKYARFTLTARAEESVTAVNDDTQQTLVYTVTAENGATALKLEDKNITYVKIS